jgi:hypothetical protein
MAASPPWPWRPQPEPDLARLAMEAADRAGVAELRDWPEWRKGGVAFRNLPVFLPWIGRDRDLWHLVLVQPREAGALVPGAKTLAMPEHWLEDLDLEALAGPLALHPDLEGRGQVHVVRILGPGKAQVRTLGAPDPALVEQVLAAITGLPGWNLG